MTDDTHATGKNDNVNIYNPTSNEKKAEGYAPSDVEQIYEDAHPTSWQDLVKFIESKGDEEWHITPGEAKSMKNDFSRLAQMNVPFTSDPQKAYQEANKQ